MAMANMAYKSAYHEDSDADDEYERSVFTSPTLPPDFESSPTDSEPLSTEHTPTTFTHSGELHASPRGMITDWTAEQCADFIASLGPGLEQYADIFVEEAIDGGALIALQHSDLKDLGMTSVGHRLTVLKSVYEVKVKQNVPIDPDDYVPLSADTSAQDATASQDDIARIIQSIKLRDERIIAAEAELRMIRDDLNRVSEENRKLREEMLPLARTLKEQSQPLPPNPAPEHVISPPIIQQEKASSGLSRKFSTKKLFLGSAPKNPSPTIHEGRTLADSSSLDPSAAAMAASTHLTASMNGGLPSPAHVAQHSPTSPQTMYAPPTALGTRGVSRPDGSGRQNQHLDENHPATWSNASNWSTASTVIGDRESSNRSAATPMPSSSRRDEQPGSGGLPPGSSQAPSASASSGGSSNPQVEIFKSFRVSIDDPCYKVLPVALKKYNITADWRQYALYIVHGDQERCLGLQEKPLILFKQLDREGRKPMFMLRKHAAPVEGHTSTISHSGSVDGQGSAGMGRSGNYQAGSVSLPGGVL